LKKLSVLGLGFVGLTTAVYFASKGYDVVASDPDRAKMNRIGNGEPPFFERNLQPKLKEVLENKKLNLVREREKAVLESDITFIAVGTPSLRNGYPNLAFVKSVAREIGKALGRKSLYHVVVIKSTVPPGTTDTVVRPLIEKSSRKIAGEQFGLVMSPEFLREGSAMHDIAHPDRIVIGEFDTKAGDILEKLSRELYDDQTPILRMGIASAEFAKYASNAFLSTKISFVNEMANICEKIPGVDISNIATAMGLDPRIGQQFLRAGAGWGGSCLPKDTKGLCAFSKRLGHTPRLVREAIIVNTSQAEHMVDLAEEELGNLHGKKVGILGLSFKPDTDDIRDAPSLRIIEMLLSRGARVTVYDPMAMHNVKRLLGNKIAYSKDVAGCLKDAECCLVVTEWNEFKEISPNLYVRLMRKPVLIDCRRIYEPNKLSQKLVFRAVGLGRSGQQI
jgi:UDPglucose 6-dehydrogenase